MTCIACPPLHQYHSNHVCFIQTVPVQLESPLDSISDNRFSCLITHEDDEKSEEEIARLSFTSCSAKTDNISQELDFMDVVAGFFVVQIMALYDKKWHDEYFSNVVTGFFVVQLMALHENEVLSGVSVLSDEDKAATRTRSGSGLIPTPETEQQSFPGVRHKRTCK